MPHTHCNNPFNHWRAFRKGIFGSDKWGRLRKAAELMGLSHTARLRFDWMIWYETHDRNASATSRHFGISAKTFWKWHKVFSETNLRALEDSPRAPKRRRNRHLIPIQEDRIVELKRAHIRYGKMKITQLYMNQFGESISSWKVQKVIEKHTLYYHPAKNVRTQAKRRRAEKKKRIAELTLHNRTGFLFRVDTIVRYWHGTKRYIVTAVDAVSKIAFAHMYTSHSSRAAADFLHRLHLLVDGKIENIQTDNGSEFHGEFESALSTLNLPHYWSRVKTPKDNAMCERFNRTLSEEFIQMGNMIIDPLEFNKRLTEWLIEYNFRRPHQALGYLTPMNFIYQKEHLLPMYPSSTVH